MLGIMPCSYNPRTWEVEERGSSSQSQFWLQSKLETSLDYMKPCLKDNKNSSNPEIIWFQRISFWVLKLSSAGGYLFCLHVKLTTSLLVLLLAHEIKIQRTTNCYVACTRCMMKTEMGFSSCPHITVKQQNLPDFKGHCVFERGRVKWIWRYLVWGGPEKKESGWSYQGLLEGREHHWRAAHFIWGWQDEGLLSHGAIGSLFGEQPRQLLELFSGFWTPRLTPMQVNKKLKVKTRFLN